MKDRSQVHLREFDGIGNYLLPSLGEIKEMETVNGGPSSDPFMKSYKENLQAGMPNALAYFEAIISTKGGEEKMSPVFMEHIRRHREAYRKNISHF